MKSRHRIAVPGRIAAAALGPADHRKEADAAFVQPRSLFAGGEGDIGLGPFSRPEILVAIECGGAHPIFKRQRVRVMNAHAPLLGRVDEKNPAERPEYLTAERLLGLLIEHDDLPAGFGKLRRSDEAGK